MKIEKLAYYYFVSMGIYLFETEISKYITPNQRLDHPELVMNFVNERQRMNVFNFDGRWLDIGHR